MSNNRTKSIATTIRGLFQKYSEFLIFTGYKFTIFSWCRVGTYVSVALAAFLARVLANLRILPVPKNVSDFVQNQVQC